MSGRVSSAVTRAVRLVAAGTPIREAADRCGVAPSSVVRARARANATPLKRGRPALTKP